MLESVVWRAAVVTAVFVAAWVFVWVLAQMWASTYLAAPLALVAGAIAAWAVDRLAPRALERAAGLPVVRLTVEPDTGRLSDGWSLLLDGDLPSERRPVGGDSLSAREWLVGHGAADLDETYLRLAIEGRSSSTVRIREVRAVILDRRTPFTDTRICSPSGGDSETPVLGLNLDDDSVSYSGRRRVRRRRSRFST